MTFSYVLIGCLLVTCLISVVFIPETNNLNLRESLAKEEQDNTAKSQHVVHVATLAGQDNKGFQEIQHS